MSAGDIDYGFTGYSPDLGGMTEAEIMGRGRIHDLIDHQTVVLTEGRVRKTRVLERLQAWRDEDALAFSIGGRPSLISERAVITAMLLLAKEGSAMFLTNVRDLFMFRLSDASRELLGLEKSTEAFVGHVGEKKRWYANTSRAFHRMTDLMDPFPQERRHSKTYTEIQAILRAHDVELEAKRKARLDEFTKLFLVMTYNEQPRNIRRASKKIDLSFDQTYIGTPTVKGYSKKDLAKRVADESKVKDMKTLKPGPVDAYAGWHVTTGPRTDVGKGQTDFTEPGRKADSAEYRWGWEVNIAVRVDSEAPGQKRFPALAVAATMSLPNVRVAEEAVSLMRAALALGLEAGVGDADKQYWANSLAERLHEPAFNLGFTPSTDYRTDRLGNQGGDHGALYIEGGTYCPATPAPLQNATKDLLGAVIDTETYRARIAGRTAFKLHVKEKPDAKGRTVLRCPALGPSPTVTCPLRELLKTRKVLEGVDSEDLPDFADKICTQHSVSFDTADNRRTAQAFDYGTKEWDKFHTHARNSIESLNNQVKSGGTEDIESASRRRVRGFGAAQIIVTMLLTNFNLRKIAAFISDKIKDDAKKQVNGEPPVALVRRRDREFHNPYTDTYPPDVKRPTKPKRSDSDETGGPPRRT
ncbi:hypothetical protein [Cryobacterium psychrophilum]|uniref:Uncharacterized protein n=1 Tax=Cryobacterium psychrophilum TaxID=41988 RepID=A0A4R8AC96_9MICO|nr:hypothetical protein [Cryobacterium psychrophilum]TDW28921.1 hypothetical protein EDD25_0590 [Cryobacterium psychrophilum]TDW28950.1 hypothetical protein EDD25_0620 [Cryobacterium psychrophilum]TFD81218.1 hypothetical protein E3T53_03380 [Cryobacterium psychrophilum]